MTDESTTTDVPTTEDSLAEENTSNGDGQAAEAEVVFHESDLGDELHNMQPQQALDTIVRHAAQLNASDMFVITEEHSARIAVRRLGTVEGVAIVTREKGGQIVRAIKANGEMDIAETRRPLDGRYIHQFGDKRVDLRVNTIPTLFGEDLTARLLDRSVAMLSMDELGMDRGPLSDLMAMLSSPSGLILVTGPTGTGKTTTMYAGLHHLNQGSCKINTLEDPIEYAIGGICQSQVNAKLSVNFPELLASVLRQSPDVIMIGEIRDEETATTAVRAANSGHLVLATLHAPVAAGAIQSMLALGVHPYFLASCILGVIAQRLIRTLRQESRIGYDISIAPDTFADVQSLLGPDEGKMIYGPDPTDKNSQGGYDARTGLFEVMTFNQKLRKLVADARPSSEIEQEAIKHGMVEFRRAAMLKVARGITSTEEMLRAIPSEYLGLEED